MSPAPCLPDSSDTSPLYRPQWTHPTLASELALPCMPPMHPPSKSNRMGVSLRHTERACSRQVTAHFAVARTLLMSSWLATAAGALFRRRRGFGVWQTGQASITDTSQLGVLLPPALLMSSWLATAAGTWSCANATWPSPPRTTSCHSANLCAAFGTPAGGC